MPSHSPSPPLSSASNGHYPPLLSDSFDDDYYHSPRRSSAWAKVKTFPYNVYRASVARFGRRRGPALLVLSGLAMLVVTFAIHRRFMASKRWQSPFDVPDGPVFHQEELRKIWEWEILAGHYPSTRPSEYLLPLALRVASPVAVHRMCAARSLCGLDVDRLSPLGVPPLFPDSYGAHTVPSEVGLSAPLKNPALPASVRVNVSLLAADGPVQYTLGAGGERMYPELRNRPPDFGRPPRPVPGGAADFDRIMASCEGDEGHVRPTYFAYSPCARV